MSATSSPGTVTSSSNASTRVAKLVIEGPDGSSVTFPIISPEILIGRLPSVDLVLDDPAVSRIHAKIVREARGFTIVDLDSSTGTWLNGAPIVRHDLVDGDVLQIATMRLRFRG